MINIQKSIPEEMRDLLAEIEELIIESRNEVELADSVVSLCHNINQVIKRYDRSRA